MTFNRTKHKELWMWLSEHPGQLIEDWPGWDNIGPTCYDCFACKASGCNPDTVCILDWGSDKCTDRGTFYHEWSRHTAILRSDVYFDDRTWYEKRVAYLAKVIANLPLRDIKELEVI